MGFSGSARSTAGTIRAFPTLGRRLFYSEKRMDEFEAMLLERAIETEAAQHAVRDLVDRFTESTRRLAALEQQVEQLHATLTATDPQMTLDIVSGVREDVTRLSIRLTEQMNATSELLAELSTTTSSGAR